MKEFEEILVEKAIEIVQDQFISLFKGSKELTKDAYDRLLEKTKLSFRNYFSTSIKKYSNTKTILYRREPRYLYDFYVNLDLIDSTKHVTSSEDFETIIFGRDKIIISGTAGSGKSTLMKHFFLSAIETKKYIPVFIELRNINNTNSSFHEFISESLTELNFKFEEESFKRLLKKGAFVFLFDGFDEIDPGIYDSVAKQAVKFSDRYHENIFIVSTRPDDRFISWSNYSELEVCPMNKDQCLELISKIDYNKEIKDVFKERVYNELFNKHESFLRNPLLTTIMLMTYEQYGNIPDKLYIFYQQAFETLFQKHDATKSGFKRLIYSNLDVNQFKDVLASFCIISYIDNKYQFLESEITNQLSTAKKITNIENNFRVDDYFDDLLKTVCILLKDGFRITFTHRSFQEYFSALYISKTNSQERRKLLQILKPKLLVDNAIKMVYELNKNDFEDDFLIPELSEIAEKSNFDENFYSESLKNYLKFNATKITILHGSIIVDIKSIYISNLLKFTSGYLKKEKFKKTNDQKKLILDIIKELLLKKQLINKKISQTDLLDKISTNVYHFKPEELDTRITSMFLKLDLDLTNYYLRAMQKLVLIKDNKRDRIDLTNQIFSSGE